MSLSNTEQGALEHTQDFLGRLDDPSLYDRLPKQQGDGVLLFYDVELEKFVSEPKWPTTFFVTMVADTEPKVVKKTLIERAAELIYNAGRPPHEWRLWDGVYSTYQFGLSGFGALNGVVLPEDLTELHCIAAMELELSINGYENRPDWFNSRSLIPWESFAQARIAQIRDQIGMGPKMNLTSFSTNFRYLPRDQMIDIFFGNLMSRVLSQPTAVKETLSDNAVTGVIEGMRMIGGYSASNVRENARLLVDLIAGLEEPTRTELVEVVGRLVELLCE